MAVHKGCRHRDKRGTFSMHAWQEERSAEWAHMACTRGTAPRTFTKNPRSFLHSIVRKGPKRKCICLFLSPLYIYRREDRDTHRRCPPRRRRVLRTYACPRCSASASAPPAHPRLKNTENIRHPQPHTKLTTSLLEPLQPGCVPCPALPRRLLVCPVG